MPSAEYMITAWLLVNKAMLVCACRPMDVATNMNVTIYNIKRIIVYAWRNEIDSENKYSSNKNWCKLINRKMNGFFITFIDYSNTSIINWTWHSLK
jgi:hypothetical protein